MPKVLNFSLKTINPTIHLIDTETYEAVLYNELNTLKKILSNFKFIPLIEVKAVLVSFYSADIFQLQYQTAEILKEYYQSKHFPIYFCSWNSIFASALLLACVKEHGEKSLEDKMEFIICENDNVTKFRVQHCKTFYKIIFDPGVLLDAIQITKDQPKTFITFAEIYKNANMEEFCNEKQKHIFETAKNKFQQQSKSLTLVTEEVNTRKAVVKKLLQLLGIENYKYDVASISCSYYGLIPKYVLNSMTNFTAPEALQRALLNANVHDIIPFKKTVLCYQDFHDILFAHFDLFNFDLREEFSLLEYGTLITLNIDKYYISSLKIKREHTVAIHGAIIYLSDEKFTVRHINNNKLDDIAFNRTQILGLNNVPLAISFTNGKIQIGDEALKLKAEKDTYVIYDLLKIIKTPAIDFKPDSKWRFKISQNENDGILLEFDTFKGQRKASPAFLFAFFIRYSIKAIEIIFGEIPKPVVFVSKNLNDTFRQNLIDSCKIAKLDENNVQINEYKIVEMKQ